MKTWIVLAVMAGALLWLPGCSACGSGWANCSQSWDFYEQCDLIEGREARCCAPRCYDECAPGTVVESTVGNPIRPCRPGEPIVVEETIIESGPMAGEVVETRTIEIAPEK